MVDEGEPLKEHFSPCLLCKCFSKVFFFLIFARVCWATHTVWKAHEFQCICISDFILTFFYFVCLTGWLNGDFIEKSFAIKSRKKLMESEKEKTRTRIQRYISQRGIYKQLRACLCALHVRRDQIHERWSIEACPVPTAAPPLWCHVRAACLSTRLTSP